MDAQRFDQIARHLARFTEALPRRGLLQAAGAVGATIAGGHLWLSEIDAKKSKKRKRRRRRKRRRKKKDKKFLCRNDGSGCRKKGKKCKPRFCLKTPFAVEAHWTSNSDHDTFLFVPKAAGASLPSPFITNLCNPEDTDCELDRYPFTCVNQDAKGPGDEITTVRQTIPGTYEYWIDLDASAPAGDVTVTLRQPGGAALRSWTSPGGTALGWHVFNIVVNGKRLDIISVDQEVETSLPDGAHNPNTDVCPDA